MEDLPELDLSLPFITRSLQGIGGTLREKPEDFQVTEIPLYEPCGEGNHLYVNVTKVNMTTRDVQLGLAKLFGLKPEAIGKAGLKDKRAVSTQTFSILMQNKYVNPNYLSELIEEALEVKVNWAKYHKNKLRAGHLIGNRFVINITGVKTSLDEAHERAIKISEVIKRSGLPNYYGEQRMGDEGNNVIAGLEIIRGSKRIHDRWLRKYLISSFQSYLCNRYLSERVKRNLFSRILLGDIAKKHETGGIFWVTNPNLDQSRFESKEISFTAPIYGYKMAEPKHEAAKLEREVLEGSGLNIETFKSVGIEGTRRLGRILPIIDVSETMSGIQLEFDLPKGGFATIVLREFMKNEDKFS